jgi:hypothetical protein
MFNIVHKKMQKIPLLISIFCELQKNYLFALLQTLDLDDKMFGYATRVPSGPCGRLVRVLGTAALLRSRQLARFAAQLARLLRSWQLARLAVQPAASCAAGSFLRSLQLVRLAAQPAAGPPCWAAGSWPALLRSQLARLAAQPAAGPPCCAAGSFPALLRSR